MKNWDWEYDRYHAEGVPNPNWVGYCAMNLFAVKHNADSGEFEDFRILEKKSNDMFHAFE